MSIVQSVKRNVQNRGNGTATLFGDRGRSWGELRERVARLAGGLKSLGVAAGDRVAILALNSDRYLEAYVAVPWAGAVIVPLNIRWSPAELAYALNDSGACALVVDDASLKHAAPLQGEAGTLRSIIYIGDAVAPAGLVGYEALIEAHSPLPDAGKGGEDLAGIFYTGGTTGFPKGVDAVAPQSMVECDGMACRRRTEPAEGHAACGADVSSGRRRPDHWRVAHR